MITYVWVAACVLNMGHRDKRCVTSLFNVMKGNGLFFCAW